MDTKYLISVYQNAHSLSLFWLLFLHFFCFSLSLIIVIPPLLFLRFSKVKKVLLFVHFFFTSPTSNDFILKLQSYGII